MQATFHHDGASGRAKKAIITLGLVLSLCLSGCSGHVRVPNGGFGEPGAGPASTATDPSGIEPTEDVSASLQIDPFDGLDVQFDGVSPFVTVAFNTSKCSQEAQELVQYSLSPDSITTEGYFALNDTVMVYASLQSSWGSSQEYSLATDQKSFTVIDVPQYVTEITPDVDLSRFRKELSDYRASITAWKAGDQRYDGWDFGRYVSSSKPAEHASYFSALKSNAHDKYEPRTNVPDEGYFNRIDVTYSVTISVDTDFYADGKPDDRVTRYFTIYATNIVMYPDGSLGWGGNDPQSLDFNSNADSVSMDDLVKVNLTAKKADYNVDTITGLIK